MESGQSFATSCDALSVRRGMYGPVFIQQAQRLIQAAIENLRRYDDLVEGEENFDEKLLERLSISMTPAQIEEAAQIFESDMRAVARQAASAMNTVPLPATAMLRPCCSNRDVTESRSALIFTLV